MPRFSRRTALKAVGSTVVLSSLSAVTASQSSSDAPSDGAAASEPAVETVVSIPDPEKVPENMAVAENGCLYFGIARSPGEVWRLTPEQTQQTGLTLDDLERKAQLPEGTSVIGVEVVPDGDLYAAVGSEGDDAGVWRIPHDGGEPEPFAAIPGFANDVLYDPTRARLLVTESFGGAVYEVPLDACDPARAATVWAGTPEDDSAGPLDTGSFGANGLTFGDDGAVYVAVTRAEDDDGDLSVGRLVRVPVADDGSAGAVEPYVESRGLFGGDGVTARGPHLYVAVNAQNRVVRVTPAAELVTVASGNDGLVFPSDVVFGRTPEQRGDLFIANFANDSPEEGAILRTHP